MGRRGRSALAAALAALAVVAAGCDGEDDESARPSGPDPAALAPADAPIYLEGVVRPQGEQAETLEAALSQLLDTEDPGGFIVGELDQELSGEDTGLSYEEDIEPWLGERAGLFFTTLEEEPDGAAIVSATDEAAARAAIERGLAGEDVREATYEGVEYTVDDDEGTATGIVGDFLVAGSPEGFKAVVDASRGRSLAEDARYSGLVAGAPEDAVGTLYGDPQAILDALEAESGRLRSDRGALEERIGAAIEEPFFGALTSSSDSLALELSYARVKGTPSPERSPLLGLIPEQAWLAFAVSDLGSYLGGTLELVASQDAGTAAALEAFERTLGVDQREIGAWAGDIGGYLRGTSIFGLGAALIVETEDERASADTLETIQGRLSEEDDVVVEPLAEEEEEGFSITPSGLPIHFDVVQREGRIVAGPEGSVEQVLAPEETLEDSEGYQAATGELGEGLTPVVYLDFVSLLDFVEGIPNISDDADYRRALPHLEHLSYLVAGSLREGERDQVELVLGLREPESE